VASLTVIIPCYNEEFRLDQNTLLQAAEQRPDFQWLLVDDGSTDGTRAKLELLAAHNSNVHVLFLEKNSGKAEAIRQACLGVESE